MTEHVALIPNRARTDWHPFHYRPEDLPVLREIFLGDVYHLEQHAARINGGVCVDVGANIGAVTRQLLDLGARKVIAIEPEPENRELLVENVGTDPRVAVLPTAVGDPGVNPTASIVGTSGTAYSTAGDDVHVAALGEVLNIAKQRCEPDETIALLKVDVEGAEYPWFATDDLGLLAHVDLIAMEWHGTSNTAVPVDRGAYGTLLTRLARTHAVSAFGEPDKGGMLYAHAYGPPA